MYALLYIVAVVGAVWVTLLLRADCTDWRILVCVIASDAFSAALAALSLTSQEAEEIDGL